MQSSYLMWRPWHCIDNIPLIDTSFGGSHGPSHQLLEILAAANMAAVKVIESDTDFQKQIKANKFVLAIFMEDDTEIEVWGWKWDPWIRNEKYHCLIMFIHRPIFWIYKSSWRMSVFARCRLLKPQRPCQNMTSRITSFRLFSLLR